MIWRTSLIDDKAADEDQIGPERGIFG